MAWLRRAIGNYRMWWGWCPSCNSDAPAIDTCPVCVSGDAQMDIEPEDVWERFAARSYR